MVLKKLNIKPLNEQVRESLLEYIRTLDLSKGRRLPGEDIIAKQLGVSRITVRNVMSDLAQEGVVSRVQGRGTFVNQEALEINIQLNISPSFEEMIRKSGYEAEVKLIDYKLEKAGAEVAKKLQIDEEDEVVRIEKMFYADGNPAIFCIDRFPSAFLDQPLEEENIRKSIYTILHKRAGQKAVRDVTDIFNIQTDQDKKLAKVFKSNKTKSLLVLDSVNINQEGEAILYDTEYYDTEYIKFSICRKKDISYIE